MYVPGDTVEASRARYDTSKDGLKNAGLVSTDAEEFPSLIWIDGVISYDEAATIQAHQRVNKIPGMDYLCCKSVFFTEMNDRRQKQPSLFDFYPKTFLLPDKFPELQREHTSICSKTSSAPTWVVKPSNGSCGKGIQLIQSIYEAQYIEKQSVAQMYVNPFTLDGYKFDFRFFVLISTLDPLSIFIYKEGIARFCTEIYSPPSKASKDRAYAHLTNTAINVCSSKSPDSFTKKASEVMDRLGYRKEMVWADICKTVKYLIAGLYPTIMTAMPNSSVYTGRATTSMSKKRSMMSCKHFFHILGVDIILDDQLKPMVLELNDRPSLAVTVAFEKELKTKMIREAFFHVSKDGSYLGEHEESQWCEVFSPSKPDQQVDLIMNEKSQLKYSGRIGCNSSVTNRMLMSGINQQLRIERIARHNQLQESLKARRFHHYTR